MAEIKPLRPWRYNKTLSTTIDQLTAPLFDVVSEKQREVLYQNPYNSIHLSVPEAPGASRAAQVLEQWKTTGVILQDRLPAIYVYYQYFSENNSGKQFCRKGFVCDIRIYDWRENIILRHENTIPNAVNDRTELLRKTELNASPTFGLYTDKNFELEKYMDEAIANPVYETEDYQGARDVLAVIHDASMIQKFIDVIIDKKIILADGHHRYEGSLIYKHEREHTNKHHTGKEGYNFHTMYLCNTEGDGLRILPTHRLVTGLKNFNVPDFLKKMEDDFTLQPVQNPELIPAKIDRKKWTFGIILKNAAYKASLKPESFSKLNWPFPKEVNVLDLTVLHYFILEKVLGIPGKIQRQSANLKFERSIAECIRDVSSEEAQVAIITNGVSIDEVKSVCNSGSVMPQKSTYFYPKIMCGFLFESIREEEFQSPDYFCF